MINKTPFDRLIKQSVALIDGSKHRHFSFIMQKGQVMSVGQNNKLKTHPLALRMGFKFPYIHSEVSAILKFPFKPELLQKCIMVNIRLNKSGQVVISKPCKFCQKTLIYFGFEEVFYSNDAGNFTRLF